MPVCMRQATTEQKRQPALLRTLSHWLIPSVSSDFTGTITAGNRHYRGTTTTHHCTTVLYCTVLYCIVLSVLYYCTVLRFTSWPDEGLALFMLPLSRFPMRNVRVRTTRDCFPFVAAAAAAAAALAPSGAVLGSMSSLATT